MRFAVKEMREEAGITIEELAEKSGVSIDKISDFEENRIEIFRSRDISNIAKALGISASRLFVEWLST